MSYDFIPTGRASQSIHKDVILRARAISRRRDREGHRAPRRAGHTRPTCAISSPPSNRAAARSPTSSKATSPQRRCILANLSMQLNRPLAWDASKGQVTGDAEANRLLKRAYRKPWVHPGTASS